MMSKKIFAFYTQIRCLSLISLIVISSVISNGQSCNFFNTYGDNGTNTIVDFVGNPSAGFTIFGKQNSNMHITKLDPTGNLLWTVEIEREFHPRSITRADNGDYLICADSSIGGAVTIGDIFIMRFDINGVFLWGNRYSTPNRNRNVKLHKSINDQYIICYGQTITSSVENLVAFRIDGNGSVLNSREYAIVGDDQFYDQVSDGNGGVILCGGRHAGSRKGIIMNIDANLAPVNTKDFIGVNSGNVEFAAITEFNGDFITVGEYTNNAGTDSDLSLRKFDNSLNLLWEVTIDHAINAGTYLAGASDITTDQSGNIYVSARNSSAQSRVFKFDFNGNLIWAKLMPSFSTARLRFLNSEIIVYGNYNTGGANGTDFFFGKETPTFSSCIFNSSSAILNNNNYTVTDLSPNPQPVTITVLALIPTTRNISYRSLTQCYTPDPCSLTSKFNYSDENCVGEILTFTNLSVDLNNNITNYQWNFGDNTSSISINPTHVYLNAGTYVVELISQNDACPICYDTLKKSIQIEVNCIPCEDCIGSFAPTPGKNYILEAWAKQANSGPAITNYDEPEIYLSFTPNNSTIGPFKPSGIIIDGWQRIEKEFFIPASAEDLALELKSTGGDVYFDDIRIYPFDGSAKSYVYDPISLRLNAELDERNYATIYEYDEEGKLTRVKKETERGIMTIQETRTHIRKQ